MNQITVITICIFFVFAMSILFIAILMSIVAGLLNFFWNEVRRFFNP